MLRREFNKYLTAITTLPLFLKLGKSNIEIHHLKRKDIGGYWGNPSSDIYSYYPYCPGQDIGIPTLHMTIPMTWWIYDTLDRVDLKKTTKPKKMILNIDKVLKLIPKDKEYIKHNVFTLQEGIGTFNILSISKNGSDYDFDILFEHSDKLMKELYSHFLLHRFGHWDLSQM